MSFFKKLFGNNEKPENKKSEPTGQDEMQSEMKAIAAKYKRTAVLLGPRKARTPLSLLDSKFGGTPNALGFESYPVCASCGTPLNFVLQLYRSDFPQLYFPENTDLFQLFRCPVMDCVGNAYDKYDLPTYHYYFAAKGLSKELANPGHNLEDVERPARECRLQPETTDDYPQYDDYDGGELDALAEKYGDDVQEDFMDTYMNRPNTKVGGYPSFTQSAWYPECSCGKTKEFFFQLASDDSFPDSEREKEEFEWSPHGIMMGDVGNIYFYVCRACGPQTIQTYWDCS